MRVLLLLVATVPALAADDADAIVRRSLDLDNRNWERAKDYTFRETSLTREYDAARHVKKTESETHDITILYGRPLSRLIEKNGKPLSERDAAKESAKFDRELEKRRRESQDENSRERRKFEERRRRNRQFAQEIPNAFTFTLRGEENVDGHPAWIIAAEPKPGFQPRDTREKFLPKLRGVIWIDKSEYQWVRVEAETIDTISLGWFLARLGPGATLRFEQKRVNDEVWLPARGFITFDGRLLINRFRGDVEIEYRDYRRFQTDTRIIVAGETTK